LLLLPFQPRKRVIPNGSASLGILGVVYAVTLLKPRKNGKGRNQQPYALKVFTLDKNIFWLACAFSAICCVTTLMGGNKSAQMLATASATLMVGGGITRLVSLVLYILFYLTDKDNRGLWGLAVLVAILILWRIFIQ
jgi:hypothetical protein